MIDKFVHSELAIKLKELGFNEECISYYYNKKLYIDPNFEIFLEEHALKAPLWQQTFDWFRNTYKIEGVVKSWIVGKEVVYLCSAQKLGLSSSYKENYSTYEEAREACLFKLIKLCQERK